MTSNLFWGFAFISIFLIAGCKHPASMFNLPLGKEELRGSSVRIKNNELWNTEKKRTISFDQMIDILSRKSIVYIGEKHDNVAHHQFQLDIIKALYEKNPNIIIGVKVGSSFRSLSISDSIPLVIIFPRRSLEILIASMGRPFSIEKSKILL